MRCSTNRTKKQRFRAHICPSCGVEHYRWSGNRLASYCAKCHAAYMREHRPTHSELAPEQRRRQNARAYARMYVLRGALKRRGCEVCGKRAQMHHDDYSKPLEVRWLCRRHHLEHHLGERRAA